MFPELQSSVLNSSAVSRHTVLYINNIDNQIDATITVY